jgi:hypothetical protein
MKADEMRGIADEVNGLDACYDTVMKEIEKAAKEGKYSLCLTGEDLREIGRIASRLAGDGFQVQVSYYPNKLNVGFK